MSFINTVFGIPLGYVMWGCYQLVKNYGLSIILFTLVSKIVMLPVSIMVQKNSIRMIQIQPQINEIKYKFVCMGIYGGAISIWVTQSFCNILRFEHLQSGVWNHLGHLLVRHALIYLGVILYVSFLSFV